MQPAVSLRDVFNAADPTLPLESGDPRYVDCTPVRGNEDVVRQLYETIIWSNRKTAQLFTGHRGCGKSTELLRLKNRLEEADYAVIYFAADDVLDLNDIVYSDVLVAIASQVYAGLAEAGVGINQELLDETLAWFAEVVYQYDSVKAAQAALEAEFKWSVPKLVSPFAQLMAKITGQLRTSVESKRQVRQKLDPQLSQLIDRINLLLLDGQLGLRKAGKQGPVVIIDNLDRIPYRTLPDAQRNSHDALYIDHGEQLTSLNCHLVYTVPIAMFYSTQASILGSIFPDHLIMPMIKVHNRSDQPYPAGLAALRDILARRTDLAQVFDEAALSLLIAECGGHPRDLMTLVRYACRYAANRFPRPIDSNAAQRAVDRLVNDYGRMIPEEHFPLLVQVARSKQVENDDAHRLMLHNLSVLEYVNGAPVWHDVHPVVRRLPKFQEAEGHGRNGDA